MNKLRWVGMISTTFNFCLTNWFQNVIPAIRCHIMFHTANNIWKGYFTLNSCKMKENRKATPHPDGKKERETGTGIEPAKDS